MGGAGDGRRSAPLTTRWNSQYSRHRHRLKLEKATIGVLSGLTCYHFRCTDEHCHAPVWCYKHEFWGFYDRVQVSLRPDGSDPLPGVAL